MVKIGKIQTLSVVRNSPYGLYLNDLEEKDSSDILLPKKQVPEGTKVHDKLDVFVYRDSEDRLIATMHKPLITIGELAVLRVVEVTRIGAFLHWNLEKDLLLPFKEQTVPAELGREYLVALYIDKSNRLCATMKIYNKLNNKSPYAKDDKVEGIVYDIKEDLGVFVAIDHQFYGLIPKKEVYKQYTIGDRIEGRVLEVREDGKINISVREKAYMQMDEDAKKIYDKLIQNKGFLGLHDKSNPELIKKELQLSKNAFKRGVGRLLKEGRIVITEKGIQLK